MKKADFQDVRANISGSPDQKGTLILDIPDFKIWLNSEWTILKWEEWNWKRTRIPRFVFSIMVPVSDGVVTVEGEIDNNQWKRVILSDASYKFVAIFMRKLKDKFPGNDDIYTLMSGYSYVKLSDAYSLEQIEATDNSDILEDILVDPGLSFMRKLGEI